MKFTKLHTQVPIAQIPMVMAEYLRGIVRNSRRNKKALDVRLVEQFFADRYKNDRFDDIADGRKDWYLRHVEDLLDYVSGRCDVFGDVCDLGCGSGEFIQWLSTRNFKAVRFVGVEQDKNAVAMASALGPKNATFFIGSLGKGNLSISGSFRLATLVNVLPYMPDVSEVMQDVAHVGDSPVPFLLIIDPLPSWFWERHFGGFSIRLRKPNELDGLLLQHGWEAVIRSLLVTLRVGNVGLLPLSHATLYRQIGP